MFDHLLDLFFPRRSLSGRDGTWFTEDELARLDSTPLVYDRHFLRSRRLVALDGVSAALPYIDPMLKRAIHTCKYRRVPALQRAFGELLQQMALCLPPASSDIVLCPVPLHWTRQFWRGFNQAELLAQELGYRSGLRVRSLLVRTRPTGHQARRNRRDRFAAMRNAFRATGYVPRRVILVDDLFTTGATLDACAIALKRAGAEWVEAAVLAAG